MPLEDLYTPTSKNWIKYLQALFIVLIVLYFGRSLFIPLTFGLVLALIMYPVCRKLEDRKWPRSAAIFLVISIVFVLFIALLCLLGYELNIFLHDVPRIKEKLLSYSPGIQNWLQNTIGINEGDQSDWLDKLMLNIQDGLGSLLKTIFSMSISMLFTLIMIPVYASLFLYHRGTFVRFLYTLTSPDHRDRLRLMLQQSTLTYFHFVKGTFFVYLIVGVLNSIGLLMLGIEHAILYGMITAFMTIIPYVGIMISASMPFAIALVTRDSLWYPAGVILLFTFVQYLEANVIFPRIVGVQLNLSTWSTLVAMIAGTILWGVAGMILFVPLLAILKIYSDQDTSLKPLNILLNRKEGYLGK
ncbi:MAG TPA: AI-2E family transporter [Puia sp.]|jgi:predicted PurR-regulated permease PerM|nr:AI-2E family transporter [Puia sp.]